MISIIEEESENESVCMGGCVGFRGSSREVGTERDKGKWAMALYSCHLVAVFFLTLCVCVCMMRIY